MKSGKATANKNVNIGKTTTTKSAAKTPPPKPTGRSNNKKGK